MFSSVKLSLTSKLISNIKLKLNPMNIIKMNSSSMSPDTMKENKINVNGIDINYIKTGSGSHPVLLLPGALGSSLTDFKPQLQGLDKKNLTIIAWDPPGYGKSIPPSRKFGDDFFYKDAINANDLMKKLGYNNYSLVGWSDGGITGLIIAASNRNSIKKLVVFGANSYILPQEVKIYESIRNINSWSERMKAPMIAMYGEDYFRKTWSLWVDAMINIYKKNNGDICRNLINKITCPTLIVHGNKDVMVDPEHPVYLHNCISNSKLKYFEKGAHNLHLKYHEEFNQLVTNFLLEN
ncbi:hypothetical protein HCN44_003976 [Aphidius gifuensis]|uniref:AB hydrolase-1 domain-containing protein n=1 Tax=Aphidius gifuensis TaxID=684658 RepID=A0A835CT00_APHGI|nr:valacyclovir hydrolase [Aphidius gifuensis]KAF7994504.1 hypothetical protein HCN44_003976 [Aphidius gifuensis]